jgi:hypothetical protein
MIHIDTAILEQCIGQLGELESLAVSTEIPVQNSLGTSADAARQVHELLNQLATQDLPALFSNSALLLSAIKTDFERMDVQLGESY